MAIKENEHNIEETQATHSKKAQILVLGVMCLMLILVTVNAIFRTGTNIQTAADNRTVISEQSSAEERNKTFNERMANANRLDDIPDKISKSYDDVIAEIRESAKPEPIAVIEPVFKVAPELTEWQKKELELIRASRYDDYQLTLKFPKPAPYRASTSVQKRAAPAPRSQKYDIEALARSATPPPASAPLDVKIAYSDATIKFAKGQLAKLAAGEDISSEMFPGMAETPKSSLAGQAVSTLENEQPLPGQKLLPIGTMIRASYDQKVVSDYVGPFRLRVTQDVYDATKSYVLIPKGSLASCTSMLISNINEPIQARMGYIINYMVLPDGKKIDFSKQAGLDREGIAGVKDEVNRHLLAQFLGVAAYVLIASDSSRDSSTLESTGSYSGEVGNNSREIGGSIAEKYLSLVPTITINPGTNARIFIEEELYIYPWEKISAKYVN